MLHADSIKIDNDEGRITLVIDVDPSWRAPEGRLTFDIHSLALEFYDEVRRELGPYVREAECARGAVRAGLGPNGEQVDEGGYDLDDPKHPTWPERVTAAVDMDAVRRLERLADDAA